MTKNLIIGLGEVGNAIQRVFGNSNTKVYDSFFATLPRGIEDVEYMHICFPYSESFVGFVQKYQDLFKPKWTIIHSSVPVGTTKRIENAVHAPIRGLHPNLEKGIRIFPMFIGGTAGSNVADYFRKVGLKIILIDQSEATEAGKLLDTEYYKVCIEFAQRVKVYCDDHDLNFHEVYTLFNQTYNEGYKDLHHDEFIRPVHLPAARRGGYR